ncbi:MAG: glycosyltransferase family 4 protein [Bacteroidetes bacterium]|nr:glycosyltransferase family 4 protein [Bacteroidota bacterium]
MNVVISVGGRFHAIELAEQLDRRGYLERIITTKSWYVRERFSARRWRAIPVPEYLGELVRRIPILRHAGYYSWLKDNLFDVLARRYIPPCDIFHVWGNYALASIPHARKHGAHIVLERGSSHPYYQDAILREEFERFGVEIERAHPQIIEKGLKEIELVDRVIIPSEFVYRSFVANGVPEEKLRVIPYGFNPDHFRRGEKTDDVFRVLFVGNIGIQKGVHYLLDAWERLALPNAELVFVGKVEDGMRPLLEKHAARITLRGHVRHEDLHRAYAQASVFVLPSLQEGSALVTYEAMACGLPLLVSENTGSVARDGEHGFVIPIRSADAIAEKLQWLFEHPEELKAMGVGAHAHVQQFTWDRYARSVIEVYRELLGTGELYA